MWILNAFPITTAVSIAQAGVILTSAKDAPLRLGIMAAFNYGSGGTTADAYVQTSFDGGATFWDLCNFHFTTSSVLAAYFNLSALTAQATQITSALKQVAIAANTAQDGFLGARFQCQFKSTGTYAGGTTLSINLVADKPLRQWISGVD